MAHPEIRARCLSLPGARQLLPALHQKLQQASTTYDVSLEEKLSVSLG